MTLLTGRYELEYVLNVADTYGLYVSIFDSAVLPPTFFVQKFLGVPVTPGSVDPTATEVTQLDGATGSTVTIAAGVSGTLQIILKDKVLNKVGRCRLTPY